MKEQGISKYFNLKNITNFIEGNINSFKDNNHFFSLEEHVREQVIYRALQCIDCLQEGHCLLCGCKTPEMFYAPKKIDADGKWNEMLSKEEWMKFKEEGNIILPEVEVNQLLEWFNENRDYYDTEG